MEMGRGKDVILVEKLSIKGLALGIGLTWGLAMLVDVMLVLDELVLHHLLQIGPLGAQVRQAIDHVLHEVESVQVVLHPHVEGRRDGAFFLVAADVQVAVGAAVGQPVDQPGIPMEAKDDVLVFREERIVIRFA